MKNIFVLLICICFSSSFSIPSGIYGTYSYHIMSLESSRISIFEDGTYQFEFRFMSFKKFISEGVWEYIGDDKYIIKTLYDHNSIPINVVEKSTGSDSLTFVVIGGSWWTPAEELHIDSVIYYLKPKQNVLNIPKTALKVGSVIFYSAREETPDTVRHRISHANILTVDYRICNPEADLFELSFPVKPPFRDFLDYFFLEEFNDTIVIRNGELFHTDGMLDDVTSGFNISNNLSNDVRYNEILGFTDDEVERLIDECGVERKKMTIDRKFLYNGYSFHENAKEKLYNSSMMLYFLNKVQIIEGEIDQLIDYNLKTDYGRIKMLLNRQESIKKLEKIIEFGKIPSTVSERFQIDKIHDAKNFLSLLYYMGLVTLDKDEKTGISMLKIPNYSIKTMYWEYMENMIMERNPKMLFDPNIILESLATMAFDEDYKPFFMNFHKNFVSNISNRDLIKFSEKNVKFLLLSILFQNNLYLPISEIDNSAGYTDVYLQRRNNLYPGIKTDWIWEIKYIKDKDRENTELITSEKANATEQLKRYKRSNLFKDRTDVRYLAVVFIGKKDYWTEEVYFDFAQ